MSSKKPPSQSGGNKPDDTRLSRGRTRSEAIFPVAPAAAALPESYAATLQEIKARLRSARVRAILAANPIVIEAYWHTCKIILARQQEAAWGAKVIDRLAVDLKEAFPDMGGLSGRKLLSMKRFAEAYPDGPITKQPVSQLRSRRNLLAMRNFAECLPNGPIVQQAVAQLPWRHIVAITQRLKSPDSRDFYIRETIAHGWSRSIFISPNGATHTSPEQRSGITATTPFPSPEGANHSPHP